MEKEWFGDDYKNNIAYLDEKLKHGADKQIEDQVNKIRNLSKKKKPSKNVNLDRMRFWKTDSSIISFPIIKYK